MRRLTPTHANNHGRRYRYYVSRSLTETGASDNAGWRIPAREVEQLVADIVRRWLLERAADSNSVHNTSINEVSYAAEGVRSSCSRMRS